MADLPSYARLDPALCLAPGLFRSLGPKDRPRERKDGKPVARKPLYLEYDHGPSAFTFRSPVLLGCDDMRIMQAVAALAPRSPAAIAETVRDKDYKALRDGLTLSGGAERAQVALVTTSFAELSRAAGYGSGGDVHGGALRNHVKACLKRLAGVKVEIEEEIKGRVATSGWQLLAFDGLEKEGPRGLRIVLNPRSSACAHKTRGFTHLDLTVARELEGSVARLLHQRLSALTERKGLPRALRVTTMMGYAWNPNEDGGAMGCDGLAVQAGSVRKRRFLIKEALKELDTKGWTIGDISGHPDTKLVKQLTPKEYQDKKAAAAAAAKKTAEAKEAAKRATSAAAEARAIGPASRGAANGDRRTKDHHVPAAAA